MKFLYPGILYLLLLVPASIMFFIYVFKIKNKNISAFGNPKLLFLNIDAKLQKIKSWLIIFGLFFLIIAMAGPQIGTRFVEMKRSGIDIIIAIDTSISMMSEDIKPNRLAKAKSELYSLIDRMQNDRVGIIAFAGTAFLQCPLTLDTSAAKMLLNIIDTNLIPVPGTSIGEAINLAVKSFTRTERKYKVLILLTDGEDHNTDPLGVADEAKKEGVRIYTIGIGSAQGDLIPVRDQQGGLSEYKKDKKGETVMTKLDEVTLQKIALQTGGKYYQATGGEIEVERIYEDISNMEKKNLGSKIYNQYEDRFQYFLFPAVLLLIIELLIPERKKGDKLKEL